MSGGKKGGACEREEEGGKERKRRKGRGRKGLGRVREHGACECCYITYLLIGTTLGGGEGSWTHPRVKTLVVLVIGV